MPPLMGAGAFVMVELTGVPYTGILVAALMPALLYFFAVWVGVNAFANRYELKGLKQEDQPSGKIVIVTILFFLIPFAILLERMFVGGYTPQYAASIAILAASLMLAVDARLILSFGRTWKRMQSVFLSAGQQIATIASIILCASIIISVLGQTGLGVKITSLILSLSASSVWPALLLTALACLILGMEVPTTAAYVICVSVAGPALQSLGLPVLQVHLFVFWFALLSTITPPVCGTVFIAAGMVEENWLKVAVKAMILGVGLYLIPLAMVANPELIQLEAMPVASVTVTAKIALGLATISYGIIVPKTYLLRTLFIFCGSVLIFLPLKFVIG